MEYYDAEEIVQYGGLIAALLLLWSHIMKNHWGVDGPHKHYGVVRVASLMALAFAVGLYLGIEKTAKGWFNLPLGVMQKQMHEVWDLPMKGLLRPVDKVSN